MTTVLARRADRELLALLRLALDPAEWQIDAAANLHDFSLRLQTERADVVLIDLDHEDGVNALVETGPSLSVVIAVTADPTDLAAINAHELGADAVYHKPLAPDLMRARLEAAVRCVRKHDQPQAESYTFDNLQVDLRQPFVSVNGKALHLSSTEHKLIRVLAENAGRVLTHDQLLRTIWGEGYEGNSDLLRTFVSNLRRRLLEAGMTQDVIRTERSLGYWMLRPPVNVQPAGTQRGRARVVVQDAESTRNESRVQRERLRAEMGRLHVSISRLKSATREPPSSDTG
jgi:two-component system KDP operon response regulator KdpE